MTVATGGGGLKTGGAFSGTIAASILPVTTITYNLGSAALRWLRVYAAAFADSAGIDRLTISQTSNNVYKGTCANSGTNSAHQFLSETSLTGNTNCAEFAPDNSGTAKNFKVHNSGKSIYAATDASGTPGDATIDKPSGQVAFANGAATVTVTNSLVATTSVVVAVLQETDGSLYVKSVVPGAGSFVINLSGNATSDRTCGFVVFN